MKSLLSAIAALFTVSSPVVAKPRVLLAADLRRVGGGLPKETWSDVTKTALPRETW